MIECQIAILIDSEGPLLHPLVPEIDPLSATPPFTRRFHPLSKRAGKKNQIRLCQQLVNPFWSCDLTTRAYYERLVRGR